MQASLLILTLACAQVDAEDLRRGLVATHEDGAKPQAAVTRLEPTVALNLKTGEAAHPRLEPDGTVRWQGHVNITRADVYRFRVRLRGGFKLRIGVKEVLAAEVKDDKPALKEGPEARLEAGVWPIVAEFTRLPGAARVEVLWSSKQFHEEPLPFDVLGHLPKNDPAALQSDALAEQGRFLAEEHACIKCHQPADDNKLAAGLQPRQGPDLSKVGARVHQEWLYRWLESPRKLRPGSVMPELFGADDAGALERYAVSSYLVALGGPIVAKGAKPQPKQLAESVQRGKQLFVSLGCVACHGPPGGEKLPIKEDDDPKTFLLHSAPRLYPFKGMGGKTSPDQLATYLRNPLSVSPGGRMPHMLLDAKESLDLAHYLCDASGAKDHKMPDAPARGKLQQAFIRLGTSATDLEAFQRLPPDGQWVALGRRLVQAKNCAACHTLNEGGKPLAVAASTKLVELTQEARQKGGCLAEADPARGKAPRFSLAEAERKALRGFLSGGLRGAGSPAPAHAAQVSLRQFNCLACHGRDGEGGPSTGLVELLRKYEKADNAEAVVPPPLTGVGHELRTPWLRDVLTKAGRARPWMGLRMPQFGEANVGNLPEGLAALEGTEPVEAVHKVALTGEKIGAGRFLVGKSAFGCVSCHDLAGIPNHGTRGPDLASMGERVRHDWYLRWLENAQRIQPGTRMPTVFLDGKTQLASVLNGDAEAQADAMWAYLSLGPGLPLPEGLEKNLKGLILSVKDRPMILRTFLPEAGTRAIAVGYSDGLSVAFDATRCRLSYAWTGNFLDVSPVWNDRGGNPARLLGPRVWTAPAGFPWGTTPGDTPPDFIARAKDPGFGGDQPELKWHAGPRPLRFEGYSTDTAGQPAFRYRTVQGEGSELVVEEKPAPLRSSAGTGIWRQFTLQVPAKQTVWLLAGESEIAPSVDDDRGDLVSVAVKDMKEIDIPTANRAVLIQQGGRQHLLRRLDGPKEAHWRLQRTGSKWQVLLKLPANGQVSKMTAGVAVWTPHRNEPALLKELLLGR